MREWELVNLSLVNLANKKNVNLCKTKTPTTNYYNYYYYYSTTTTTTISKQSEQKHIRVSWGCYGDHTFSFIVKVRSILFICLILVFQHKLWVAWYSQFDNDHTFSIPSRLHFIEWPWQSDSTGRRNWNSTWSVWVGRPRWPCWRLSSVAYLYVESALWGALMQMLIARRC